MTLKYSTYLKNKGRKKTTLLHLEALDQDNV